MAKLKTKAVEEMEINLFAPGMGTLHKVGLAGLWMTLKRFEKEKIGLPSASWQLTPRGVILRWHGSARSFLQNLVKKSFRLDRNGLVHFTALGTPGENLEAAVVLHKALLGTFLQHGKSRKADSSQKPRGVLSFETDESTFVVRYPRVSSYRHQTAHKELVDANGELKVAHLAGWQYPGAAVRHTGWGNISSIEEPPARALALLYAPVGGIYLQIKRRGQGVRPLYALVLPEISDLEAYAEARALFLTKGIKELLASGTADAGWRVLATLHAKRLLSDLGSPACAVVSFGVVPWSKQQKTRVDLFTVKAFSEDSLRTYSLCRHFLAPTFVKTDTGGGFWDVPETPELVARNLTNGRSWYTGFADFTAKKLRRMHVFSWERGGLNKMVGTVGFSDERDRVFVEACHEAYRRRLGQIGERVRREGVDFRTLATREFERLRVRFSRCKNAQNLREEVTDFWARSGSPLPALQSGWQSVVGLLDENNWRKAKDLALLALASYHPVSAEERKALELSDRRTDEGAE